METSKNQEVEAQYIVCFDKLEYKEISKLTIKETISLIFHSIKNLSNCDEWDYIYTEYQMLLNKQNNLSWPKMAMVKNSYLQCIQTYKTEGQFVDTKNILMLLLRFLIIESCKLSYIGDFDYFPEILNHSIDYDNNLQVTNITILELFDLIHKQLLYYIKIHSNTTRFEYQLAKSIIDQIN